MIDEILEKGTQKKQPTIKSKSTFIPPRFSVRGLRKHPGIQANRNPIVIS